MRGQLPKAYLRIDPNIDQHPDMPLLVKLLCAANRQDPRGHFKTWAHVLTALGAKAAASCRDGGHIEERDGGWVVEGWDLWQEGDINVGQRMRMLRERKRQRNAAVTDAVTQAVTSASQKRISPSEASRRQGVKAVKETATDFPGVPPGDDPSAKPLRPDTWLTPYLAAWSERFPGSKPAAGKLAGFLAPLEKLHEPMLVLDHWRRYLERTEAQFVSPARFAETFPSWGPGAREPTNGAGKGTVAQRTMDTAKRLLIEFEAEERGRA